MTATEGTLGGWLTRAAPDPLAGAQRDLFDAIRATAAPWATQSGFAATTSDAHFIRPFDPSLLNPAIASVFLVLQAAEQRHTPLDERVRQVVIVTVGAVRQAPNGRSPHSAVARHAGLPYSTIAALPAGHFPDELTEEERTAYQLARTLSTSHHVEADVYQLTDEASCAASVFAHAVLAGIYHTVCAILSVSEIPAPAIGGSS